MIIEVQRLAAEAGGSGEESFMTVRSCPQYRIGVGARQEGGFFVEVIIDLFPRCVVDLDHLEGCVVLLRGLRERGYALSCERDRTVSAERGLRMEEVEGEAAAVDASARAAMG
ncbi:MAG: hypothetical protein SA339_07365 [Methanomassiliicoccus sp.]|nr:hypothetical protein [Methanomassiliicoccus sp.]